MTRSSLLSLFADFQRHARDIAVVQWRGYRREAMTYSDLARLAVACAQQLKENGVRTGDRVILWGPNGAEWMAAFWGCLLRGAAAVPIDDGATEAFAQNVARETSAKAAFVSFGKPFMGAIKTLGL